MILRSPLFMDSMALASVDDLSDLLGEGEERAQVIPVPAPMPADRGVLLIPAPGEAIQRGLGLLQGSSLIDRPEVFGDLFPVLPGYVGQAVTHHVDDT